MHQTSLCSAMERPSINSYSALYKDKAKYHLKIIPFIIRTIQKFSVSRMYSMKIQLQYLKSYPHSYAENLIFTYLFRFFFIFHIVSDVVNIYQYAKVYRTTNTGAGASFFPLKCTMCTARQPCGQNLKSINHFPKLKKITFFSYNVLGRKLSNLSRFLFFGTRNIVFGALKIGQNNP